MLRYACVMFLFEINPNWYLQRILNVSRHEDKRLAMFFSMILYQLDRMDIGQYLDMSSRWPFLRIGIAFAILIFDGTTPVTSDVLLI